MRQKKWAKHLFSFLYAFFFPSLKLSLSSLTHTQLFKLLFMKLCVVNHYVNDSMYKSIAWLNERKWEKESANEKNNKVKKFQRKTNENNSEMRLTFIFPQRNVWKLNAIIKTYSCQLSLILSSRTSKNHRCLRRNDCVFYCLIAYIFQQNTMANN